MSEQFAPTTKKDPEGSIFIIHYKILHSLVLYPFSLAHDKKHPLLLATPANSLLKTFLAGQAFPTISRAISA